MVKFFYDTYALVELLEGNPRLDKYLDGEMCTTIYNLYELYFYLLKKKDESIAKEGFYKFKEYTINLKDTHVFNASLFKLKKIKNGISYVDALGYAIAKEEKIKFLTGDKEFKNLENVEFI